MRIHGAFQLEPASNHLQPRRSIARQHHTVKKIEPNIIRRKCLRIELIRTAPPRQYQCGQVGYPAITVLVHDYWGLGNPAITFRSSSSSSRAANNACTCLDAFGLLDLPLVRTDHNICKFQIAVVQDIDSIFYRGRHDRWTSAKRWWGYADHIEPRQGGTNQVQHLRHADENVDVSSHEIRPLAVACLRQWRNYDALLRCIGMGVRRDYEIQFNVLQRDEARTKTNHDSRLVVTVDI